MDTSRERVADPESGATIRLRYSRQFQSGGHAHTIDAEAILPVGASQERREQVIRELETGVEQLARQIVQRGARPTGETRPQAPAQTRPAPTPLPTGRVTEPVRPQGETLPQRQTGSVSPPAGATPVSESMPAAPAASGERTVRLADFINVIKKYWDMSPQEAMKLLDVKTLDGLNYRDAFNSLKAIMDKSARTSRAPSQTSTGASRSAPIVEAPRQSNRGGPPAPAQRSPINAATTTTQGQAALKETARPAPPTRPVTASVSEPRTEQPREPEAGVDFAGSSRAPIPIQLGVVRDLAPRTYKFEEEDEEEEFEMPDEEDPDQQVAQKKLEELRGIRGSNAASAERLTVLNNVIDSQISEQQLQQILQSAWGLTNKKKLKNAQVEALISWAKEDFFVEEAEAMLKLIEAEE